MFANILKADSLLFLILSILATYRIAQFVAYADAPFALMKRFRAYLGRKSVSKQYGVWWSLAELIHCPYCVGLWIALPFALFSDNFLLYWFAIAGGQTLLESINQSRGD